MLFYGHNTKTNVLAFVREVADAELVLAGCGPTAAKAGRLDCSTVSYKSYENNNKRGFSSGKNLALNRSSVRSFGCTLVSKDNNKFPPQDDKPMDYSGDAKQLLLFPAQYANLGRKVGLRAGMLAGCNSCGSPH